MPDQIICARCNLPKTEFYMRTVNGKRYPRVYCKACHNIVCEERRSDQSVQQHSKQNKVRDRITRKSGLRRASWILQDSRQADKRRERDNDLDKKFVESLILNGCSYCLAACDEIKITLDRIDNTKGHLKNNVVAACLNCNTTRGNMPYGAWLQVARVIRRLRRRGMLNGWYRVKAAKLS